MKITFNSPAVLSFSLICALVYVFNHVFGIWERSFVLMPGWDFDSFGWYWRLFSNAVGHQDGNHLMGNLAFILLIGPIAEEKYGTKNTIIMLFATALVCSLIHLAFSDAGLRGASGIVFMFILLVSLVNFKNNEIPLTFLLVVVVYIGKEVMGMFEDDSISHTTHIVGGIVGAIFGFSLGKGTPKKSTKSNPMDAILK